MLTMECCSRMHGCVPAWLPPQMILNLHLVILFSSTVLSQPGLEEVFFSPQDQSVREGEDVSFRCVSGESLSPTSIFWLKDGNVVTTGRQIQGEYGGGQQKKTSGTLHLLNVSLEDDGRYVCVTYSPSLNISKKSQPAKLTVLGVPHRLSITRGPDNTTVAVGTEVSMHCAVQGFPVPMVHWFKDDCLLTKCSASFSLHNNGQLLTFRNVSKEDEGFYRCEASNLKESIKSQAAFLLLAEMDWIFIQQPTNVTAKKGDNITISCRPPYSRPAASVSWFKNNHLLRPTDHVNVLPGGDLLILSVQEEDSGSYFCRAANVHIQRFVTSRRATVTVHVSPIIVTYAGQVTCKVGASAVLPCVAVGVPPIWYNWTRDAAETKQPIGTSERKHIDEDGALHLSNVQWSDAGEYFCTAENRAGRHKRRTILSVAAEHHLQDGGQQTRAVLSASNNTSDRSQLHPSTNARKTQKPHMQEEYNMAKLCSSSHCDMTANTLPKAEIKAPAMILPSVPQMQPPMLPPPPYPNFQILSTRKPTTAEPLLYSRIHHQLATHPQLQVGEKLSAESSSKGLDGHSMESLQETLLSGRLPTPVDQSSTSQINLHPSTSHGSQTKLLQTNHSSITVTSPFPKFHLDLTPTQHPESQIPSQTSTKLSIDTPPTDFNSLPPQTDSSPSVFTHPPDPSTLAPLESLGQLNASQPQQPRPVETSKAEDEEQRNTSQSPMTSNHPHYSVTQQSPSWLPVLEKHDVPIVVGVGVSLAFIFVTVAFYSVVQKNEPAPTSRAAQRNLGVPVRHAERRAAGRTYENRAFEDDECVAVIEHNTSTCDTRARPPGLSLVTVQMEPPCEDLHEEAHTCSRGDHSVTVEMYPEPIADTKIDACVEEQKACAPPSPPSVQQQCAEDWQSNAGDNHSFCQDTLPPPSTPSPTPSPLPSPRDAGLRSSLTLRGTESLAAPIHHSLSISHGSPPLMLSHYVSLGHTTVAVDVHFYPVATSAPINSASTFTSSFVPRLANSQDSDKARVDHNK
ncbi:uncharacterized protein [Nerophis lumbriciformis]|uniref:uncharacterized protein isoform X2 n=1 Tax=Nerophis lumbriciformis TaxID=546530 RepID=UPI002AE03E51|nr:uncharacterized protein LOC133578335 isoform X2 [Nerophis lumbriciformis]